MQLSPRAVLQHYSFIAAFVWTAMARHSFCNAFGTVTFSEPSATVYCNGRSSAFFGRKTSTLPQLLLLGVKADDDDGSSHPEEEIGSSLKNGDSNYEDMDNIDDPRAFQKKMRQMQLDAVLANRKRHPLPPYEILPPRDSLTNASTSSSPRRQMVQKRRQGEAASKSMDLPEQPIVQTILGGTSMIFAMARQMAASMNTQEFQDVNNDDEKDGENTDAASTGRSGPVENRKRATDGGVLPRWHPAAGISDRNPNFRTQPPLMNSRGYAAMIWRHARKRNKPVYWRYALRTYERMRSDRKELVLAVTNIHYEGALVAAAKLGWSAAALDIYETVCHQEQKHLAQGRPWSAAAVRITENMLLSIVRACVRDATSKSKTRDALDTLVQLLQTQREKGRIPITASYWNPIAAAYQSLGYIATSREILRDNLQDRIGDPEAENGVDTTFNVYDVQAKDKGSYALLVSNAVNNQDWGAAVDALHAMTAQGGMFPAQRHLNHWTEISERQTRHRYARSWKKKRDAALAESSILAAAAAGTTVDKGTIVKAASRNERR